MNIKIIPLLISILIPFIGHSQPVSEDDAKGEFEVIADYDPNAVNASNPIPAAIILKNFDAIFMEEDGFVQLRWKIDQTLGAFIIEHSTDGEDYSEIGVINGASGFEDNYFVFEAREFDPKINFYRLKQVIDGTVIYSKPLNVSVSPNDDEHFLTLEDLDGEKRIMLRVREEQTVTIKLINSEGIVVKILLNQDLGMNEIIFRTIDKESFHPGNYFLLIEGKSFKQSKKITLP